MRRGWLAMVVLVGVLAVGIGGCSTKKLQQEQETLRQEVVRVVSDVDGMKVKLDELTKANGDLTRKMEQLAKEEAELSAKLSARAQPKSVKKPKTVHKTVRHR